MRVWCVGSAAIGNAARVRLLSTRGCQMSAPPSGTFRSIPEVLPPPQADRRRLTGYSHFASDCCEYWPIVTICGSMRFYHQMLNVAEELTLDGLIVLMPFVRKEPFMEADINHPGNVVEKLDADHKRKIDLANAIVVVSDETGYYGDSTRSEIEYAEFHRKAVTYRRISLKHTCAGHPSDACTACRAAMQRACRK
jgi:hypothetical protein